MKINSLMPLLDAQKIFSVFSRATAYGIKEQFQNGSRVTETKRGEQRHREIACSRQ